MGVSNHAGRESPRTPGIGGATAGGREGGGVAAKGGLCPSGVEGGLAQKPGRGLGNVLRSWQSSFSLLVESAAGSS